MQTPQEVLRYVTARNHLTEDEAALVMEGIMTGEWSHAQIGAYLTALNMKGETRDEIVGSAYVMRAKAFHLPVKQRPLLDIVGSGGDALGTLNVSTLAGLVASAAGARVAKHGNRAMTGMCGSADILEGLGVELDISPADAIHCIDECGFSFLFAPHFHHSMKHAITPRKEIGIPSIFNHLGPLTNPVAAERYVLGVNRRENLRRFTEVLMGLGCEHSLLVHGADGMDEITLTGTTYVVEQQGGKIADFELAPEDVGLERASLDKLRLPDKDASIRAARAVLHGEGEPAHESLVVLNAGAGIYVAGKAQTIAEGVGLAREALRSGGARQMLEAVVAYTTARKRVPEPAPELP